MSTPRVLASLRRITDRHRRPLAAALAGVATLLAISALRPSPEAPAASTAEPSSPAAHPGEVTVPVLLDTPALASAVTAGDLIDLVSIDESGASTVIAEEARVVERSVGSSPLSASSPVLLVAVPRDHGLRLATAAATTRLTLIMHPAHS